jgi:hypothetical protein
VTPLVFLLMLLVTLALLAAGNPRQAALGLAVVAAGIPVYHVFFAARRARPEGVPVEEA